MRMIARSACVGLGLALIVAPLQAQTPGIDLRLNPRIGVFVPLTDLGTARDPELGVVSAELSGGLAIGLGVELVLPMAPVNVRANLDYATGADLESTVGGTTIEPIETTLLAFAVDAVWRPFPQFAVVQPYLFGGGGLKHYDVTEDEYEDFGSESDPALHLGGGVDVALGPIALNAEVGDYISAYTLQQGADAETQHDLFATVGFAIGLF